MKRLYVGILLFETACAAAPRLEGNLPTSWGGATCYDLPSKPESDICETLDVMVRAHLRVLRLFVFDIESPLGKWNDMPLARIDYVLDQANRRGLRVIIAFHDGPPCTDAYTQAWPGEAFYTDPLARAAFRRRIEHILDYRGPFTQTVWKELGDVLLAWELQGNCHWFHAPDWIEDMASYAKQLAPHHDVASGGLGRVTDSPMFNDLIRESPSIDWWTYYPNDGEPLDRAAALLKARGIRWLMADFGAPRSDPHRQRRRIEEALRVAQEHHVPWIFWSLGPDRRERSSDLWPGDYLFDAVIAPTAAKHP